MRTASIVDMDELSVQQAGALDRPYFDAILDPLGAPQRGGPLPDLLGKAQSGFIEREGRRHETGIVRVLQEPRLAEEETHMSDAVQRRAETIVSEGREIGRDNGQTAVRNRAFSDELVDRPPATVIPDARSSRFHTHSSFNVA